MSPGEFYCPRCYSTEWMFADPCRLEYIHGIVYLQCCACEHVWSHAPRNDPPENPEAG